MNDKFCIKEGLMTTVHTTTATYHSNTLLTFLHPVCCHTTLQQVG